MKIRLWEIYKVFVKIGMILIGGGYVILPILKDEIIEARNWITEDELVVGQWEPYENDKPMPETQDALNAVLRWMDKNGRSCIQSSTKIIIVPGYTYHVVSRLITNFHQPQSTLLLLVSAFIGNDWRKVYDYALKNDFRFLSYGDSSILIQ